MRIPLLSVLLAVFLSVAIPAAAAGVHSVPKAHCGAASLPETGLQGEVPMADQFDGRSQRGYRCNLTLVGQYAGNGGAIMMAWYGHCAYMATGYSPTDPDYAQKKGVVVIDASDPRTPGGDDATADRRDDQPLGGAESQRSLRVAGNR